jgi:hypothetical protein
MMNPPSPNRLYPRSIFWPVGHPPYNEEIEREAGSSRIVAARAVLP